MFVHRLPELMRAVILRAFAKQIHHVASGGGNPVERRFSVHKSQNFNPVDVSVFLCPLGYFLYRSEFPLRYACRRDLYPVDVQLFEEQTNDAHLLFGRERDARGLLAVAQCGVHDFDFPRRGLERL